MNEFIETIDENYTMLPPKNAFGIGIFSTLFFFAFMVIFDIAFYFDNSFTPKIALILFVVFAPFMSLGLAAIAYAKLWRVSVSRDTITVRLPFQKARTVLFDDISNVRQLQQGLIVYAGEKRLVTVYQDVRGFQMFRAQLYANGKAPEQQKTFAIRQHKAMAFASGILCVLFCICAGLSFLESQSSMASMQSHVLLAVMALGAGCYLAHCIQWRITVSKTGICIKDAFRREKEHLFRDMTKVHLAHSKMIIFVHHKKVAEIPIISEGFATLVQRLGDENIPFV